MIPTPKYEIGQKVFAGNAYETERPKPCPDCLGKREWEAATPAGETFSIPCGTCASGYWSTGSIWEWHFEPSVKELTIGSVRLDTADTECVVCYMCHETGIGSGQIWREHELYLQADDAMQMAVVKANEATTAKQQRIDKQAEEAKRKAVRKPTWERRRIKELEKELKELRAVAKNRTEAP